MAASLSEFAAATAAPTLSRWLQAIPEWEEIRDGYRNGVPATTIWRWLRTDRKYPAEVLRSPDRFAKVLRALMAEEPCG